MSNFTFTFEVGSLAVAANLTEKLELFTGATVGMTNNHIGTIYHEITPDKAKEFFKIVHDLNETPISDGDGDVKYVFNVSTNANEKGLNDMVGDLKNWHVKESQGSAGSLTVYSNQLPATSVPDQGEGDDSARDVDAGTEPKYPFSSRIVPMRVMAAYNSNLTDLLENEAALQLDANTQIGKLQENLLNAFGNHSNKSHDVSGVENYGKKMLRQAINEASTSVAKSNRLAYMFEGKDSSGAEVAGNVVTGYDHGEGEGTDNTLQVTKFNFEPNDEIKFIVDLNTSGIPADTLNPVVADATTASPYEEPATYRFLAHLKFVPEYYYSVLKLVDGQIVHFLASLAAASADSSNALYLDHNLQGNSITWDLSHTQTGTKAGRPLYSISETTTGDVINGSTLDNDAHLAFLFNGTNVNTTAGFVEGNALKTSDAFAQFMMEAMTRKTTTDANNGAVDLDATKFKRTLYAATGSSNGTDGTESEVGEIIGVGYEGTNFSFLIRSSAALTTNHVYQDGATTSNPLYFKNTVNSKRYYLTRYFTAGDNGHYGEANVFNDSEKPELQVLDQSDFTNNDTQANYRAI